MSDNLPSEQAPEILTLTIAELDELVQECSLQAYVEDWLDEQLISHNACDTQFRLSSVTHSAPDSTGHTEHYVNIHVWANSYEFYGGLTDEDNYYEVGDMPKIISVHYTQLNSHSCLRETYHNENMVSVETLEQSDIPLEVQRLMLMPVRTIYPDPTMDMLSKFSMEEVAKLHGYTEPKPYTESERNYYESWED